MSVSGLASQAIETSRGIVGAYPQQPSELTFKMDTARQTALAGGVDTFGRGKLFFGGSLLGLLIYMATRPKEKSQ